MMKYLLPVSFLIFVMMGGIEPGTRECQGTTRTDTDHGAVCRNSTCATFRATRNARLGSVSRRMTCSVLLMNTVRPSQFSADSVLFCV
jgi:hypothetical protein